MKNLLLDCKTTLGLAKSMAERECYDTDVYDIQIQKLTEVLNQHNIIEQSEQLPTHKELDRGWDKLKDAGLDEPFKGWK